MNKTNNTQTTKVSVVGISAQDLKKLLEGNAEDFAQFLEGMFSDKPAEKSEPAKPADPVWTVEDRKSGFDLLNMSPAAFAKFVSENPQCRFPDPIKAKEPVKEWTLEEIAAVPVRERLKLVPRKLVRHDMKGSWVMRYADSCCILPYEMEYGKNGRAHLDQTCAWQGYIGEKPAPKTKKIVEYRNVYEHPDETLSVGNTFKSEQEARHAEKVRIDYDGSRRHVGIKRVEFEVTEGQFDA